MKVFDAVSFPVRSFLLFPLRGPRAFAGCHGMGVPQMTLFSLMFLEEWREYGRKEKNFKIWGTPEQQSNPHATLKNARKKLKVKRDTVVM